MKIVTSASTLDLSGVPTFTLAMYNELVRRGHEVTVYSQQGGKLEEQMNTVKKIDEVPMADAIIASSSSGFR